MAYKISYENLDDCYTVTIKPYNPELFRYNRIGRLSLTSDAEQWIKENIKGGYRYITYLNNSDWVRWGESIFYFTQEDSLLLFKLRYC